MSNSGCPYWRRTTTSMVRWMQGLMLFALNKMYDTVAVASPVGCVSSGPPRVVNQPQSYGDEAGNLMKRPRVHVRPNYSRSSVPLTRVPSTTNYLSADAVYIIMSTCYNSYYDCCLHRRTFHSKSRFPLTRSESVSVIRLEQKDLL